MSGFGDLRGQLSETRARVDASAVQFASLREQLKTVQREIAALERLDGGTGSQREKLAALHNQEKNISAEVDAQGRQLLAMRNAATQLLRQLTELQDPTKQLSQLSDLSPILLFPVRLEVRFRPAAAGEGAPGGQLWIRIYPDDCQVDSFETLLTDTEVQNLTAFWTAMWRAAGVEAQERGAWRALVGGSGSGRAAYLIGQYAPTNPADKPAKASPQDVVLVILPQIDVTAAEQAAAFAYWMALWRANGDRVQEQAGLAALRAAVGDSRAKDIVAGFAPDANGWDPPKPFTRALVNVSCSLLRLPAPPPTKQSSWTHAPRVVGQPDRFVALLYTGAAMKAVIGNPVPEGLATGPDPSLPKDQQISIKNDDLQLNDDLRWLADFEKAVAVGMGMKVNLTATEAQNGFDRLLVVGVRVSSDENDGKQLLQTLIAHQYASKGGYSLVPQGSPTNNTGSDGAAYTWVDDPDASYDIVFKATEAYAESIDPLAKRDGQWLAEALGTDDALMKRIPHANGVDQMEARAMNIALWNGTLGYMLEEMLTPLFSRADIGATRLFFTRSVLGRGPLPAVRVGKQPYGILPVTSFSRYRSTPRTETSLRALALADSDYLQRLHALLSRMDKDWLTMSSSVARVGQPGDAHQTLLDILGLHSGSVEYHQRYAESFDQLYNKLVIESGQFFGGLLAAWLKIRSQELLSALGADPNAQPPILEKFFYGDSPLLTGPIVDDAPVSESKPIRAYTPDKKNYIEWLATASLDVIRRQDFGGNPQPTALLYLMLRHSMMLGQWDAGTRFLEEHALVDPAVARLEPSFINVRAAANTGQSKFQDLYRPQPAITGNNTQSLGEYVLTPGVLDTAPETEDLREIVAALNVFATSPTARLERIFAEHIDCCSYRLDAWKAAFATDRLAEMRGSGESKNSGIHLGAYGWLENLRPKQTALQPVSLEGDLAKTFQRPGDAALEYDSQNAGYIHAPSLSQAAAAAILKNAYRVNASLANPDAMAVNLSSDRVRQAQSILEGMRNGQTLGALLGYRFERGLHDDHALAEVDKFIYPLRRAFPLVADKLKSTQTDGTVDITLLEARNVLDGVRLMNQMRTVSASYPFGLVIGTAHGEVPAATAQEATAINAEADRLLNLYDALGDLVMAESVFQVVLGNFDRSAAVTKAFSSGAYPPEMQVVKTPRTGLSLTHRVALHLDSGVNPDVSPSSVAMTPRARAEASLNEWLSNRMPPPSSVTVNVTYATPALAAPKSVNLMQEELQLQPMDLLYLVNLDLDQAMTELDDRIVQAIRYGTDGHPDITVTINYTQPVSGTVTLFELAALVRSLRPVVLKSRALGPTDMAMPLESKSEEEVWDDTELAARVQTAISALTARRDALQALETDPSDLDTYVHLVTDELLRTALHGMPQTGTGQIHADIRAIYEAIVANIRVLVKRWTQKSTDYAALLATWPALTNDDDRFAMLRQAERLIVSTTTAVPPADPNVYKTNIENVKTQFDVHLTQFQALLAWNGGKLVDFSAAADALKPIAAQHDVTPFDINDQKTAMTTLLAIVVAKVTAITNDLTRRINDANALTSASGKVSPKARVQQIIAAGKLVLGSEMQLIPRFRLSNGQSAEFQNAWNGSAALLTDLKAAGRRFPVDDWLYGLARVREQLNAWENVTILSEGFGADPAEITPVQLPFLANDRWTALEFDTANAPPGNRLLYSAHWAKPFAAASDQCGLLIDEWPETVPGPDIVSGVTFHFDRPNSQPPQTMLLAVPPLLRGSWSWDDLVATLNETLDEAKKRGVEPAMIDNSNYAQFLPATLMAVTLYATTISTNLALNNQIYDRIGSP